VRSTFLIQVDVPYVTLAYGDKVEDGFGDALLRMKARLWRGGRRSILRDFFAPRGNRFDLAISFSTGSTDIEVVSFRRLDRRRRGGEGPQTAQVDFVLGNGWW